jgi:hypothetical protein
LRALLNSNETLFLSSPLQTRSRIDRDAGVEPEGIDLGVRFD